MAAAGPSRGRGRNEEEAGEGDTGLAGNSDYGGPTLKKPDSTHIPGDAGKVWGAAQRSPVISPPPRLARAGQIESSIESLTKSTRPSAYTMLAPPGWRLPAL